MAQRNVGVVFIGVGFEALVLVAGAAYLGAKIDQKYKLNGLATAGLVVLAVIGWMVRVFTILKDISNQDKGPPDG